MSEHVEGIEEVVVAVNDPEAAVALFEDAFGFRFDQSWEVPADKMKVRCAMVGQTQFHIVGSTTEASDALIPKFLSDRGEGLHHVAFKVRDLDRMIETLKEKGLRLVPEKPRNGRNGSRYIFVHPKSTRGLLIELIQRPTE